MLVAALLWLIGSRGPLVTLVAPAISIVTIAMTAVVLVVDLERPERFYYILTRSNWRSWRAISESERQGPGSAG